MKKFKDADLELRSASLRWSLKPLCSENACFQHDFSAPPPSIPPPLVLVYNLSAGRIRTWCPDQACVLAKSLAWLFMQKHTHFRCQLFCTPFRPAKFSAFFGRLFFRIPNPLSLSLFRYTLVSNPNLQSFCTLYANDLAKPASPVLIPVFPFLFNEQWRAGVGCEEGGSLFYPILTHQGWI